MAIAPRFALTAPGVCPVSALVEKRQYLLKNHQNGGNAAVLVPLAALPADYQRHSFSRLHPWLMEGEQQCANNRQSLAPATSATCPETRCGFKSCGALFGFTLYLFPLPIFLLLFSIFKLTEVRQASGKVTRDPSLPQPLHEALPVQ